MREACPDLSVAMEPTGTYGDTLRSLLQGQEVPVFRVSPKRVHDAAEDFDGVPSTHDAKAAAIIAQQHWDGKSHRWETRSDSERQLKALVEMASGCNAGVICLTVRLESKLARHFPELGELLELGSTSLLSLLVVFPSPARITASREEANALPHREDPWRMAPEMQAAVLETARTSTVQPMITEEEELVREL